jgi:hypothetical protein
MRATRLRRKCKNGVTTIRVPLHLHAFIVRAGEKMGLNNYELVEKMAQHFAPLFCPELTKFLNSGK